MKFLTIPQDKANHFIYGFTMFILLNLFLNAFIALGIVFIIALSKEIYDEYDYGGYDWQDLLATIIPASILILKESIL